MKKTVKIAVASVLCLIIALVAVTGNGLLKGADMTPGRFFTLSDEAREYLSTVTEDVKIEVLQTKAQFIDKGASQHYFLQATRIIDAMGKYKNIDVSYIDFDDAPEYAESADKGDIVVTVGEKHKVLTDDSLFGFSYSYDEEGNAHGVISASVVEEVVCSAINDLSNDIKPLAVFSTGSGEHEYIKNYVDMLTRAGYDIAYTDMNAGEQIPDECELLIIFAPAQDLSYEAETSLEKYMYNDGEYGRNVIYVANSALGLSLPNISSFLSKWGVSVGGYTIMETEEVNFTSSGDAFYTEDFYMSQQFITDLNYLENAVMVPMSHPIIFDDSQQSLTGTALICSSDTSTLTAWDDEGNVYYGDEGMYACVQYVSFDQTDVGGQGYTGISGSVVVIGSECAFEDKVLDSPELSNRSYLLDVTNGMAKLNEASVPLPPQYYEMRGTTVTDTARIVLTVLFAAVLPAIPLTVTLIKALRKRARKA